MNQGADVTAVVAWGLRRYAWVVALFVVVLGVLVPGMLAKPDVTYQATAQVGPIRSLRISNFDVLPRLGTEVFDYVRNTPQVKQVAESGGKPVGPDRVKMVAGQDNVVFSVVAYAPDPVTASQLANVAANAFVDELNVYSQSVGTFSVGHLAETPTKPLPTLDQRMAWAVGIAAGLLVGCGAVALILVLRRPVIDVGTAEQESGATVLGRITLDRRGAGATGMTQLCHRIVSQPTRMVLMAGLPSIRRERHELADQLVFWLGRVRHVISIGSREPVGDLGASSLAERTADEDELIIVDDASPVDVATRPDRTLTLLVVREGISRSALREQARQFVDDGAVALVLLRRGTWLEHLRGRRRAGRTPSTPNRTSPRSHGRSRDSRTSEAAAAEEPSRGPSHQGTSDASAEGVRPALGGGGQALADHETDQRPAGPSDETARGEDADEAVRRIEQLSLATGHRVRTLLARQEPATDLDRGHEEPEPGRTSERGVDPPGRDERAEQPTERRPRRPARSSRPGRTRRTAPNAVRDAEATATGPADADVVDSPPPAPAGAGGAPSVASRPTKGAGRAARGNRSPAARQEAGAAVPAAPIDAVADPTGSSRGDGRGLARERRQRRRRPLDASDQRDADPDPEAAPTGSPRRVDRSTGRRAVPVSRALHQQARRKRLSRPLLATDPAERPAVASEQQPLVLRARLRRASAAVVPPPAPRPSQRSS